MTEQGNGRTEVAVVQLANRLDELERLHAFFDEIGVRSGWPDRLKWDLTLSCEELVTNTISYGYPDSEAGSRFIRLTVRAREQTVEVCLEDEGVPFNPLETADPDVGLGIDEREIGGLGIFFVKRMMNEATYERTESGNRIVLRKTL
ncbi:ATP-binding protein [Cohnella suwonensis]|uniref:ATP-binding protein n=1 Tax=Cohnella suwonensis TaxID=696072 RepID=A0ABW0LTM2_9BACL